MMCEQRLEQEQRIEQARSQQKYELPFPDLLCEVKETIHENFADFYKLFTSDEWQNSDAEIPLALGENKNGKPVIIDLATAPHVLMAGYIGSAKSLGIPNMIMSLLFRFSPEQLKMILIDTMTVDFECFKELPHLITPVINDIEKTAGTLRWAVTETEKRYQILNDSQSRNIGEYNEHHPETRIPFLVVMINELADIVLSIYHRKDIENSISAIAQKGREVGIHLIFSTMFPCKDVISDRIKVNFPARLAAYVSQKNDSLVILGQAGAERLSHFSEMLYLRPGKLEPECIQVAYYPNIQKIIDFAVRQASPRFDKSITVEQNKQRSSYDAQSIALSYFAEWMAEYTYPNDSQLVRAALALIFTHRNAGRIFFQQYLDIDSGDAVALLGRFEERGIIEPIAADRYKILVPDHSNKNEGE